MKNEHFFCLIQVCRPLLSEGSDFSLHSKVFFLCLFKGTVTSEDVDKMAQSLPETCPDSNQETSTLQDGRVPPTCLTQTGPSPTAAAPTVPLLTGLPTGLPSQAGIRGHNSSYLSGVIEWSFSESQSDIQGRTGSNACVFIALYMGKFMFSTKICLSLLVTVYLTLGKDLSGKQ